MSFLSRIEACRRWDPAAYRPFVVAGRPVGRLRHEHARRLADASDLFEVTERAVVLAPALSEFESRSRAIAPLVRALHDEGWFSGWRDEAYPVVRQWGEPPLMEIERAAVPFFGLRGFGVHLNGFVAAPDGLKLWVGKRALSKPTGPGKLDHLVAGGQPHGIGIRENLVKECGEEAGMDPGLAEQARPVGLVSYTCERPEGLRDDVLFCFDLALPEDFKPSNTDGEVDAFYLWPIEQVMARIRETDDFKFNCALVVIDFLVRRGLIGPDDPDYSAIAHGLRLGPDTASDGP